jgi:hypothetical protein
MTPSTPKKGKAPAVPREPWNDIMYVADGAGFRTEDDATQTADHVLRGPVSLTKDWNC